jgi:hypothetical protein
MATMPSFSSNSSNPASQPSGEPNLGSPAPHPRPFDAVLAQSIPAGAAVLGGLDGLRRQLHRIQSHTEARSLAAACLNYGTPGLQTLVDLLRHPNLTLQASAYQLLRDRPDPWIVQALQPYDPFTLLSPIAVFSHPSSCLAVAIHPQQPWIACSSRDGTLTLWDVATQMPRWVTDTGQSIIALTFSSPDDLCGTLAHHQRQRHWQASTGTPSRPKLPDLRPRTAAPPPEPDINQLTDAGWLDDSVAWQPPTPSPPPRSPTAARAPQRTLASVASLEEGGQRYLISASQNLVRIWNLTQGREVNQLQGHSSLVNAVAVQGDRPWVASGGEDCTLRLWGIDPLPGLPSVNQASER